MDSLLKPPLCFAHRGARGEVAENTLEAFERALALGATGLESDVWMTQDGVCVLAHDKTFWDERLWYRWRKQDITKRDIGELPGSIPTVERILQLGLAQHVVPDISLDLKDSRIECDAEVLATIVRAGYDPRRVWLCSPEVTRLQALRQQSNAIRLVHSTRLRRLSEGPERHAARLTELSIDAVNFHASDWTPGLTTLFHRFERYCFSWDNQLERVIREQLCLGVDAIYGDHVGLMMQAHLDVFR